MAPRQERTGTRLSWMDEDAHDLKKDGWMDTILRQTKEDGYNLRTGTTLRQATTTLRQMRNSLE